MKIHGRTSRGGSYASHVEIHGHQAISAQWVEHITLKSFLIVTRTTRWSRIVVGYMERVKGQEGHHCHHLHREGDLLPH